MKRSKAGGIMLVFLLVAGILSTWGMIRCNEPISKMMEQAAEAALQEDWEQADALLQDAHDRWERNWAFCAAFADHEPMENINGLFAQLEIYAQSRDPQNFAAVCAQLSEDAQAMGDAHSLTWWNLL